MRRQGDDGDGSDGDSRCWSEQDSGQVITAWEIAQPPRPEKALMCQERPKQASESPCFPRWIEAECGNSG